MPYNVEEALEILDKLGYEHFEKRDFIKAIIYYERYLSINPNNADVYNILGYIYKEIAGEHNNLDKQIQNFEKALEIDPNHECALRNLALVYPYIERYQDAAKCFQRLFKINPVLDDYYAYSHLQIRLKNFEEGWKYYEYRFIRENCIGYPEMPKPKWEGQDISDKTLLVHYEQGYGDSIQFCRYIETVKPLAKNIIFRVQDELVDLMKLNLNEIEIVGMSTELNDITFDYHIPLMSLLHLTKARIDNIPSPDGYIKADEQKIKYYKEKYFNNDCFKIGITWNGTKFGNRRRNVPLKCFYPLTKLKNVKVYSLQKGFGQGQMVGLPPDIEIVDLSETFNDFSDTAAAMANLDIFVTSDNSVFNLAGAMDKKTFVLLNKFSEWRWFSDEDKTPWYDCVKIFKKRDEDESWDSLMNKVIENIVNNEAKS